MIYISYPDIPDAAITREASRAFDDVYGWGNYIYGERYLRGRLVTAYSGKRRLDYDLGKVGTTDNTKSANHLIIARADLLKTRNIERITLRGSSQRGFGPSTVARPTAFWESKSEANMTLTSTRKVSQLNDLSGNNYHLTQATAGNQPYLSRSDNRENRVLYSETFDNAAWGKTNATITADQIENPVDGARTADLLAQTAGASALTYQDPNTPIGVTYIGSIYVKAAGAAYFTIRMFENVSSVKLSDGSVTTEGAGNTTTVQVLADGWYKISTSRTKAAAGSFGFAVSDLTGNQTVADANSKAYIFGAQLRVSSSDPTYIATTTYPQYRGINGHTALVFDGVDDVLGNATDIIGTGPVTVIGVVNELATGGGSLGRILDNGKFLFFSTPSANALTLSSDATTTINSGTFVQKINNVVAITRTADGTANFYINGALSGAANRASGSPTGGTGIYLGNRAAKDRALNGYIAAIAVFNEALSDGDREAWEAYFTSDWLTPPIVSGLAFSSDTLYGPHGDDYLTTFTESSAYRHWWLDFEPTTGTTTNIEHSKHYFGNYFDFGIGPSAWTYSKTTEEGSHEATSSGANDMMRVEEPKFTFDFTWEGVSDDKTKEFMEKIAKRRDKNRFFLITTDEHQILANKRIIHVVCTSAETTNPSRASNWNTIKASFEEIIG